MLQAMGFSIVSFFPQITFADIGVPSAARMVHEADVIVIGEVQSGNQPKLIVQEVLKGSVEPNQALILADPSNGQFLSFNISGVAQIVGDTPTVALGGLSSDKTTLTLTWLNYSLWPHGYKHDTFSSEDLQSTRDFLKRLLGYSLSAVKEPDNVLAQLADDATTESAESALAYLEITVETDFDSTTSEQIRAVCAARLTTAKPDIPAVRQFTDTAQLFPATLAAPLIISWAQDHSGDDSERFQNVLYSMLSARGASITPSSNIQEIKDNFQQISPPLRQAEGRRLINIFQSPHVALRDVYSDTVLEGVLNRRPPKDLKSLSAKEKMEAWNHEIDMMPD